MVLCIKKEMYIMEEQIISFFLEGIKKSVTHLIQDYNFNKII